MYEQVTETPSGTVVHRMDAVSGSVIYCSIEDATDVRREHMVNFQGDVISCMEAED